MEEGVLDPCRPGYTLVDEGGHMYIGISLLGLILLVVLLVIIF